MNSEAVELYKEIYNFFIKNKIPLPEKSSFEVINYNNDPYIDFNGVKYSHRINFYGTYWIEYNDVMHIIQVIVNYESNVKVTIDYHYDGFDYKIDRDYEIVVIDCKLADLV